jgi:type II secretory pathway component PulM
MTSTGRNRYRNRIGMSILVSFLLWAAVNVALWLGNMVVRQRNEESVRRTTSMHARMGQVGDEIESIRTQQAALLGREALKRRLDEAGSTLEPISLDRVRYIDPGPQPRGMAMGSQPPAGVAPR